MTKFKTIEEFPTCEISPEGIIRSIYNKKILHPNSYGETSTDVNQNPTIFLYSLKSPKGKRRSIKSLVAKAFLPNPTNAKKVRNIDGKPNNVHVNNLEWIVKK